MPLRKSSPRPVAVYGASGHTGGFILDELSRRAIAAVAVGRRAVATRSDVPVRVAAIDDPAALQRAFDGCAVVINAAGPFLDTATPVIEAALASGCHYIDVTAEQQSARTTLRDHDSAARARGVSVIPAAGFYGGLAGLLAGALAGDAPIDAITVAVALDRWWPTRGTRLTGARNTFQRLVVDEGELVPLAAPAPVRAWDFGEPTGVVDVEDVPLSEIVTLHHHLPVRRVRSVLSATALQDLRDPSTSPPRSADRQGRSAQRFTMQVLLEDAGGTHSATARGRDIYAVSAPLVVEAAARLLDGGLRGGGATTLGAAFDPRDMLQSLSPAHFGLVLSPARGWNRLVPA